MVVDVTSHVLSTVKMEYVIYRVGLVLFVHLDGQASSAVKVSWPTLEKLSYFAYITVIHNLIINKSNHKNTIYKYFWCGMFLFLYIWKECIAGRYGSNCSQQCVGHCRDNATCNHVTGQCDGGCDVGWTGSMCEKG